MYSRHELGSKVVCSFNQGSKLLCRANYADSERDQFSRYRFSSQNRLDKANNLDENLDKWIEVKDPITKNSGWMLKSTL